MHCVFKVYNLQILHLNLCGEKVWFRKKKKLSNFIFRSREKKLRRKVCVNERMFKTLAGRISSVHSADFEDSALLSLRMYKSVIFSRRFERTFRLHLQALIPR